MPKISLKTSKTVHRIQLKDKNASLTRLKSLLLNFFVVLTYRGVYEHGEGWVGGMSYSYSHAQGPNPNLPQVTVALG